MEFEGFMYLDIEHPVVAWNVYRGVLTSQRLVSEGADGSSPLSMTVARLFIEQHWTRFQFEQALEIYRVLRCPDKVSRLTGLFVFRDAESALAAAEDERWGGHIHTDYLTDVGVSAAPNATRLDANWISWMLAAENRHSGIAPYWAGEPCHYFKTPIWEYLIDGAVTIWGTDLRNRAYTRVKEREPRAVAVLEQSRLAARLGSDLGHVSAFLTVEDSKPLVSFFMDFRDADNPAYTDKLNEYIASKRDSVNFADLAVGGTQFWVPDFAMFSYSFPKQ